MYEQAYAVQTHVVQGSTAFYNNDGIKTKLTRKRSHQKLAKEIIH